MAAQAWQSCKDIAHRSRTDSNYLYTTSASELFFNAHVKTLPKPNDLMALLELERAAAMKVLRDGQAPRQASAAHTANGVTIQTESVNVQGRSVSIAAEQIEMNASMRKPPKERMKREVAEPLIAEQLMQRPHDTAAQVAEKVGCSIGVIAESKAWKLNQERLKVARKQGVDPKAVKLNEADIRTAAGIRGPRADYRSDLDAAIDDMDQREQELFMRIGEYQRDHPDATPEQVASAIGCTAGGMERRQAVLNRLVAEQADDQREDIDAEDPNTKRGTWRKWVRKQA